MMNMKQFKRVYLFFFILVVDAMTAYPAYAATEESYFDKYFYHVIGLIILLHFIRKHMRLKKAKTNLEELFMKKLDRIDYSRILKPKSFGKIGFASNCLKKETIFGKYDYNSSPSLWYCTITDFAAKDVSEAILKKEYYLITDESASAVVLKSNSTAMVSNPFELKGKLFLYSPSWWLYQAEQKDLCVVFPKNDEILIYDISDFDLDIGNSLSYSSKKLKVQMINPLEHSCFICQDKSKQRCIAISSDNLNVFENFCPTKGINCGFKNVGILVDEVNSASISYSQDKYEFDNFFNPSEVFYFDSESKQGAFSVFMDERSRKVAFLKESSIVKINCCDILDAQIHKEENVEISSKGGKGIISVGGRAIAGGLLFGPVGAVIGGMTGKEKTKMEVVENKEYFLFLTVNKKDASMIAFNFGEDYSAAYNLLSIFKIAMKLGETKSNDVKESSISRIKVLDENSLTSRRISYNKFKSVP